MVGKEVKALPVAACEHEESEGLLYGFEKFWRYATLMEINRQQRLLG